MSWIEDLLGYKEILINGTALRRRDVVNLVGMTGVDNTVSKRTDLTVVAEPTSYGAGVVNGAAIEFNAVNGSAHKVTVSGLGAGPFELRLLNPVNAKAYNIVVINTDGRTLTLNSKFLTFPASLLPSATAASRTLISCVYDSTLDVFHTSLATR